MNKIRRKTLGEIFDKMVELKDTLEEVMGEEEECRDNMPENLQGSERYERADEVCGYLQDAIIQIEDACDTIKSTIE